MIKIKLSKSYNVNDIKFNVYDLIDFKTSYEIDNSKLEKIIQLLKNNQVLSQDNKRICFIIKNICYNQDMYLIKDIAKRLNVKATYLDMITKLWCPL